MANVVNVKVEFIRPQYNNLKEWIDDPNNEYVGRGGVVFIDKRRFPSESSIWANPYKITDTVTREQCLELYRVHLCKLLEDPNILQKFKLLKNKNLGCWCHPLPCHADIIVELLQYH
jgi:hypothetical protein